MAICFLCVKQWYTEKELQFSRTCTSRQTKFTHSVPTLVVLRWQRAQWEAQPMLQDCTWELLRLPLTSLCSASHLPAALPRGILAAPAVTPWYGLGESIWDGKKDPMKSPSQHISYPKQTAANPRQVFTRATHLNTTRRADHRPATNKAFWAWGSVLGLLWSQPQPEGTVATTKHERCWGSPLVLCFTAAPTCFNKGVTCSEGILSFPCTSILLC